MAVLSLLFQLLVENLLDLPLLYGVLFGAYRCLVLLEDELRLFDDFESASNIRVISKS